MTRIRSNGYLEEPKGDAKILDHYHNFLFTVNISKLELGYSVLQDNIKKIGVKVDDRVTNRIRTHLDGIIGEIKDQLNKFNGSKRNKRGIINGLGTAIKFITGNLDDNDLKTISENIAKLEKSQNREIEKINQLTSFANHVTTRLNKGTELINENLAKTKKALQEALNRDDTRTLLQNEILQAESLLGTLKMIERSISLSLSGIPNLEIVSVLEMKEIHKYLQKVYNPNQLLPFNSSYIFEILELSRMTIVGTSKTITFMLKQPILKPVTAKYSRIYPVPTLDNIILIPPKPYRLEEDANDFWTNEECPTINALTLCSQLPTQESCSLHTLDQCTTAKVKNSYEIVHLLDNKQLLVITKESREIIEDCNGLLTRQRVNGANLVSSNCKIIIGTMSYSNTWPIYAIKLSEVRPIIPEHTKEVDLHPINLKMSEVFQPFDQGLSSSSAHHLLQYASTGLLLLLVLCVSAFVCKYRKRIKELLCKPRIIVHLDKKGSNGNEDVPEPKGGGIMGQLPQVADP